MNSLLLEQGWVAPADPGPTRRTSIVVLGIGAALLVLWWLLPAGGGARLVSAFTDVDPVAARLRIEEDGTARLTIGGDDASSAMRRELRTVRATRFLVVRGSLEAPDDRPITVVVTTPAGVDADRVAIRLLQPHGHDSSRDARVLVTLRADLLPDAAKLRSAGTLAEVTDPFDERIAAVRTDRRRYDQLQDGWWWIIPVGLTLAVAVPLLLWRRARRRGFSMRLPGAGVEPATEPPSSVDPVGVAVLIAGARDVDVGAAFAGHVLDLVERRQLRMRRTATEADGGPGVLIGLGRADELEDEGAAIAVLRAIALDDGLTVVLPDASVKHVVAPADEREAWHQHVAARERFERVVQRTHAPRIALALIVAGILALAAASAAIINDGVGARSLAWLVIVLAAALMITLGAWSRDVRRWRVVTRSRRTERAQWLAWRDVIGTADGPTLDQRNLPVVAAAGCSDDVVRASAAASAVGLDAATGATFAALRTMVGHHAA